MSMMKKKIQEAIFSLSGASISIGLLGFMAGIVTLFININSLISVKWLLLSILLLGSVILIFLKIIYDFSQLPTPISPFENPIKYVNDEKIFVIRRNENFTNTIVVGCYVKKDEIDRLAYLGRVVVVQEKVIQIKIVTDYSVLGKVPTTMNGLKKIFVKPVVPVEALEKLISGDHHEG